MQSDSTGVWYFECPTEQLDQFLLELQARSVIFPSECEYLLREKAQLKHKVEDNDYGIRPLCHKAVILVPHEDKVEIIVNREQEKLDHVTQLPTRVSLLRQIDIWYKRDRDAITGICIIELDEFSNINDTVGHAAGDLILYEIARRLETFTMHKYKLVRLHGDEFALAVTELPDHESIWKVAKWISGQFTAPFMTQKGAVYLTPSIGMALNITLSGEPVTLLESAYIALNHAKDDPMTREKLFNPELEQSLSRQVYLETQLNEALTAPDELLVFYQPKECLRTKQLNGLEALIRWDHPGDGMISPGHFIPLAERTGLICQITNYVVKQVVRDLPKLREAGFEGKISINISANDFLRVNLVQELLELLDGSGVEPSDIELEITEGAFISDFNHCILLLNALHDVGFALSIDDFGTGYSSLSYLTRLPVDTIKIDMSFVRELAKSDRAVNIYKGLVEICKALDFHVLAEGVDDIAQKEILQNIGCDSIQGYLLSKPQDLQSTFVYCKK